MRVKIAAFITALVASLLTMLSVTSSTPANAAGDCPYVEGATGFISKLVKVGTKADGSSAPYFAYYKAGVDFDGIFGAQADSWYVYVVYEINGRSLNGTFPQTTSPSPAPYTPEGGVGPTASVGGAGSPWSLVTTPGPVALYYGGNGISSSSELRIHVFDSSDKSRNKLWVPRGGFSSTEAGSKTGTPRVPIGVGIAYQPMWPITVVGNSERLPTGSSLSTYTGFIGVNDQDRCSFYFGDKLVNRTGTEVDEPAGGVDDGCNTSPVGRSDFTSTMKTSSLFPVGAFNEEYLIELRGELTYVLCPDTNPANAKVKPKSITWCTKFLDPRDGNETKYNGSYFQGLIENTVDIPYFVLDPGQIFFFDDHAQEQCVVQTLYNHTWVNLDTHPGWSEAAACIDYGVNHDELCVDLLSPSGATSQLFNPDTDIQDTEGYYRHHQHR